MLIAEDRLAAAQLEAFVLRARAPNATAWHSPGVSTRAAWARETWLHCGDDDRALLTGAQSAALWRRIVAQSPESDELIDGDRVAAWAAAAWRRLLEWRIDYRTLRASAGDGAFAAFLRWARAFDDAMADAGWLDEAQLFGALADPAIATTLRSRETLWAEPIARNPMLDHLVRSLADAGGRAAFWAAPEVQCAAWRTAAADRSDEVVAAAQWARDTLRADPTLRLAIVVSSDSDSQRLVERVFETSTAPAERDEDVIRPSRLDGEPLHGDSALGAALTCVELAGRQADFVTLSAWLRSAFLGDGLEDRATRCLAEAELRSELWAQLRFDVAYRRAGLRPWLERRAPRAVDALDALIQQRDRLPRRQSPTRWAAFFSELLTGMGWPGSTCRVPRRSIDAWAEILGELARLSPIVGPIDIETALAELRTLVSEHRLRVPVPLSGVCVLPRAELVGYGYDAVWLTGMSDKAWPRAAEPNPLLPLRLQSVHAMPLATPAGALAWSRAVLSGLMGRVPQLICSYPSIEEDFSSSPSPLIRMFAPLPENAVPGHAAPYARIGEVETVEDDPAPELAEDTVHGGATTLAWQARCPLRAFVEGRLTARPLDTVTRGLDPRQRGIATHKALELLMSGIPDRAALAALPASERAARVRTSSRRALEERARGAAGELSVFLGLEQERLENLLDQMLSAELQRAEFAIEGLEIRHVVQLGTLRVRCRVDRIDRLQDGTVAVIDYKTGQRASPLDWLRPRLLEPQLPLYAQIVAGELGALVIASLQATGFAYRGLWNGEGLFPARPQSLPQGLDWADQRKRWSQQLKELLAEYAAGDARISIADWDAVAGPFAPLTRVYESLVLCREPSDTDAA